MKNMNVCTGLLLAATAAGLALIAQASQVLESTTAVVSAEPGVNRLTLNGKTYNVAPSSTASQVLPTLKRGDQVQVWFKGSATGSDATIIGVKRLGGTTK